MHNRPPPLNSPEYNRREEKLKGQSAKNVNVFFMAAEDVRRLVGIGETGRSLTHQVKNAVHVDMQRRGLTGENELLDDGRVKVTVLSTRQCPVCAAEPLAQCAPPEGRGPGMHTRRLDRDP